MALSDIRAQIDAVDEQIIMLLAARQKLVKAAAAFKSDDSAVRAPDRRAVMMVQRQSWALAEGLSPEVARRVFNALVEAFIDLELAEHAALRE